MYNIMRESSSSFGGRHLWLLSLLSTSLLFSTAVAQVIPGVRYIISGQQARQAAWGKGESCERVRNKGEIIEMQPF